MAALVASEQRCAGLHGFCSRTAHLRSTVFCGGRACRACRGLPNLPGCAAQVEMRCLRRRQAVQVDSSARRVSWPTAVEARSIAGREPNRFPPDTVTPRPTVCVRSRLAKSGCWPLTNSLTPGLLRVTEPAVEKDAPRDLNSPGFFALLQLALYPLRRALPQERDRMQLLHKLGASASGLP